MKKFIIVLLVMITALTAIAAETFTITLYGYVPEKITYTATEDDYIIGTNKNNFDYWFTDDMGRETTAIDASNLIARAR